MTRVTGVDTKVRRLGGLSYSRGARPRPAQTAAAAGGHVGAAGMEKGVTVPGEV